MTAKQLRNWRRAQSRAAKVVRHYRNAFPELCRDASSIEGWAAAAVAVAAVGASAYSAYSSSKSQKDALDYQKNNAPQFHSYTPVLAQYNPQQAATGYMGLFNSQGANAQATANQLNSYYQQSLETVNPALKANAVQASKIAQQELRGQIPTDVSQAVNRASAQASLTGGYGSGSGMGRNLVSRDLGLTSLDLQKQGAQLAGQNAALATALNPYNVQSVLGTAGDYANRYDQYNILNTGRQNQAAADAAGVANQNAVNQYNAGLAGVQASNISPATNAAISGIGTLASIYGGGGGGGYGAMASGLGGSLSGYINGNNSRPGLTGNYGFSNQDLSDIYGAANNYG